jgi:hypothetical protein
MPEKKKEETSNEYIYRCVEVIKADRNISEDTLVIMFIEYGKKLLKEKLK